MYFFLSHTLEFNLNSYQSLLKVGIIWGSGFPLIVHRNKAWWSVPDIKPSLFLGDAHILDQDSVHLSLNNVSSRFRSEHYDRF